MVFLPSIIVKIKRRVKWGTGSMGETGTLLSYGCSSNQCNTWEGKSPISMSLSFRKSTVGLYLQQHLQKDASITTTGFQNITAEKRGDTWTRKAVGLSSLPTIVPRHSRADLDGVLSAGAPCFLALALYLASQMLRF